MTLLKPSRILAPVILTAILAPALADTPARTAVNPPALSNTTQFGYSHANIVATGSRIVFVAGQVGFSKDGPNDFKAQVDRAFDNLLAALKASSANAEDVVKITLLIKDHDPAKLAYLVEKRRAVFGASPPASTLIPVPTLYADGVLFEIDAVAALKP
jgi:enamine deaminase RidA (YjgF/YER057c/UK114 family)